MSTPAPSHVPNALDQQQIPAGDALRLTVMISRGSVEACDIKLVLARLAPLADSRKVALYWQGTLSFYFEGWEQDPRELYEIPEFRAYFRALTDAWPYWWHYIEKDGQAFSLVLGLLCRGHIEFTGDVSIGWRFADPDEIRRTIRALHEGVSRLYAWLKLSEEDSRQIEQQIDTLARYR
ncbi:hypothetical protein [Allochromatium vinosum]|uniref:Uncharacterized protein n=1 Tax=Allochromatium vinosum (strain ATCC 17899 / DSM 180 / NBRC 103801 / NCIMB 10441 / D) TaxID=572477 RepID=D3RWA2_ALLVD|nr:hypothetical protein [Allochromatium vinosum]ADC64114.1 hypothetical protein Alvin_3219 [Allochromatium vinosum DSM 180]